MVIDVAGDLAALYAISRFGTDPASTDSGHAPFTEGRRKHAISLAALVAVAAAAVMKSFIDIEAGIQGAIAFVRTGERLAFPVPTGILAQCFFVVLSFCAIVLFCCASWVSGKSRYSTKVSEAAATTLSANRFTGIMNGGLQLALLAWIWVMPVFLRHTDPRYGAAFVDLSPMSATLVGVAATAIMCCYVLSCCWADAVDHWRKIVGGPAPDLITELIRAKILSVSGVGVVRKCDVFELGPMDAVVSAEFDVCRKANLQSLEASIKDVLHECAVRWREHSGETRERKMHMQIEWFREGRPASRLVRVSDSVGSLLAGVDDLLPMIHYTSSSGRTIDYLEVRDVLGLDRLPEDTVFLDSKVEDDDWESVVAHQRQVVSEMTRRRGFGLRRLVYLGLADIPQTIQLGVLLDSTRPVVVYQRDGATGRWCSPSDPQDREVITFSSDGNLDEWNADYRGPVAIKVEVSGQVIDDEVAEAMQHQRLPVIRLTSSTKQKGVTLTQTELHDLASTYHQLLAQIKSALPRYSGLHIFAATPCGASLEIGRHSSLTMYGPIHLYHYDRSRTPKSRLVMTLANAPL